MKLIAENPAGRSLPLRTAVQRPPENGGPLNLETFSKPLDAETVAVLITLRQNLIAEIERPTTADLMMIDAAIVAYYNLLRVQGWIGNSALVFEGELFGRQPLNEIHGDTVGDRLREQLERLAEVMLPLQDRCHRMMVRSLASLPKNDEPPPRKENGRPARVGSRRPSAP